MTNPADTPAPSPLTLAIFGAGGVTGDAAVNIALARGHRVCALERDLPDAADRRHGAEYRAADVLSDDLAPQLRGVDAVISCLGVGNDAKTLLDPPPLYTKGTSAICDAMDGVGCRRLVVISASFVEEKNRGPLWFKLPAMAGLSRIFDQMAQMESNLLARDTIDWTAVRPGWLMEGARTDDYTVQANVIPEGMIRTRHADLAAFMVSLAESGDWLRRTPAIARHEAAECSSPEAVAKAFLG
ncbi:NAD(P)H-binding protein [Sulfitobacter sp. HNIBRBA3233]|uniref:NAD(P)-dependent oxidoreductase n=1 Tax=Sulfitobacter marinivivus TaxID=3158558 RepID=UPI0032DFD270